jgi:hypothetical protein
MAVAAILAISVLGGVLHDESFLPYQAFALADDKSSSCKARSHVRQNFIALMSMPEGNGGSMDLIAFGHFVLDILLSKQSPILYVPPKRQ